MTAEQFLYTLEDKGDDMENILHAMREYAKYHSKKSLEEANEKVRLKFTNHKGEWEGDKTEPIDNYTDITIDEDSILNAYPLENIL